MVNKSSQTKKKQTKKSIQNALLSILQTQNITTVSIKNICQIANIHRSTFYKHYGNQFDVLEEIANSCIENTSFVIIHGLSEGKTIDECLINALKYIKDNQDTFRLLVIQKNHELFQNIHIVLPQFESMAIRHLPPNLNPATQKAFSSFVQYGTIQLLKEWIESGCLVSPEEETSLILYIIKQVYSFS